MGAQRDRAEESSSRYWPHTVSHEPTLKIGEVRELLAEEFPLLSVSKLRYYEAANLIEPHRTSTNQRMFSMADVERLRFILVEQRDRYMPLSNIAEELRQLDEGIITEDHPGIMRALPGEEMPRPRPGTRLRKDELAALTGVSVSEIEEIVEAGLLEVDPRGRLTAHAVDVVTYVNLLRRAGLDMRQIRQIRTSARSHADIISTTLRPQLAKQTPVAKERAYAQGVEMSALTVKLYQSLLAENLESGLS